MFPCLQNNNVYVLFAITNELSSKSQTVQSAKLFLRNMFIFKYILIISGLCEVSFANLKLCSQLQDKISEKEILDAAFICLSNETGYSPPFPIGLTLEVYFKNVIKIDEDLNSITIQLELWAYWADPGLVLTNHRV